MIHSTDFRASRYGMLVMAILYVLLLLVSIAWGNPFFLFPGYLFSWIMMIIFLILIIIVHPFYRRLIIIPYVISQIAVIIYMASPTLGIFSEPRIHFISWIAFTFHLISLFFGLLSMILPLFIFLRKDIYQKPFIVLAVSALIFHIISQMWYGLFLVNNIAWMYFYLNSIRVILSIIPFVSIIFYTVDTKYILKILHLEEREDSSDDELFGWLTLGIYTIYLAVTKPYKK